MSKLKKKRLSEKIIKKSVTKSKGKNPFEVHINRQKFDVLGKKSKNDRGLPGVSKSKSLKKRKDTLLQEYKVKGKTNKFLDRRIGEKNSAMTSEDRVMARYTAEIMKAHNKKTMFNLADDEILTHRGQSLSEIERFDDPRSDDEDEDELVKKGGGLEASFVGDAHFGGGIFREKEGGTASRATLIEELIAESKKRKAEKLRAKEQTLELTEKLDSNWQELLPLVNTGKSTVDDDDEKPEKQSYDHLMRQLKFESRGKPSDKLRSEEEIAREEKMKLEKLEAERLMRMRGSDSSSALAKSTTLKHQSADDLDDGLDLKSDTEEVDDNEEVIDNKMKFSREDDEDDDDHDDSSNDEDGDGSDDDAEEVSENVGKKYDQQKEKQAVMKEGGEDEEKEEEEGEEGGDEENEAEEKEEEEIYEYEKVDREELDEEDFTNEKYDSSRPSKKENSAVTTLEVNDAVNSIETPLTPRMPENYDDFQTLMKDFGPKDQAVIVERLIKCYHPTLGENNRQKLENLFTFLLQHLNDAEYDDCWKVVDCMSPHLYDLTQFSPMNSANCLMEVLAEKQSDFQAKRFRFPESETLLFLKLVPLLFPSSDVRHPVVTPAYVFMCQMLNQCRVVGRRDITAGLFIVTTLLEYSSLSKRFCPEVVRFLEGILQMATPGVRVTIPNCKSDHHPLILKTPHKEKEDTRQHCSDLSPLNEEIDEAFQVRSISVALKLTQCIIDQYAELPAFKIIFKSIKELLSELEIAKYPDNVVDLLSKVQSSLEKLFNKKLQFVVSELKRPKALKLYEPMIEKVVDGKKKFGISEEQAEHQKLLAKLRQETKGAMREIRRDRQFLAKIKFHEQAKSDAERKRKVKQIYGWGAEQQGELNKMKRKKK